MTCKRAIRKRPESALLRSTFLETLRRTANVSDAARAAGIDRKTAYNWRRDNVLFCDQWKQALEEAADVLEAEARRRAIEGYDEPLIYGGRLICDAEGRPVIRKRYSDGLLRMLLRAHRPAQYRDGRTESTEPVPAPVLIAGDDIL